MKITFIYKSKRIKLEIPDGTGNVAKIISKKRFYEQKLLKYITSLKIEGTYIDVGANVGNHSIYFGIFTSAKNVISIEAHKPTVEYLKKNIANNNLTKKIFVEWCAAGSKSGRVSLQTVPSDEIGGSKVVAGKDVPLKTIDSLVKNEKVGLVKIDIEGYELEALKGMKAILGRDRPELFIESTKKSHTVSIKNFLSEFGYKITATYNNSATHHFTTKKPKIIRHTITRYYPVRRLIRGS